MIRSQGMIVRKLIIRVAVQDMTNIAFAKYNTRLDSLGQWYWTRNTKKAEWRAIKYGVNHPWVVVPTSRAVLQFAFVGAVFEHVNEEDRSKRLMQDWKSVLNSQMK